MPTALDVLNSSDEEDGPLDPVAEARRQRAIQLLAKVLKKPVESNDSTGKPQASAADTDAEVRFLQELLNDLQKGVPATKVASGIRDRLSVLGVMRGGVQVAVSSSAARNAKPQQDEVDEGEPGTLPGLLERLKNGDKSAVSETIRNPSYWRAIVDGSADANLSLSTVGSQPTAAVPAELPTAAPAELPIPAEALAKMRTSLAERGYGAVQPGTGWSYGDLAPLLAKLRAAADAMRAAGWPPVFVFCLDEAWQLLDLVFAPMEALLGEGCRMDPSVFCWIASTPPALNTSARDRSVAANATNVAARPAGSNFGMPHRDFTCLQSLREGDGAPMVLSVWLPLNDVTPDNGCMMVIPRPLDRHFLKRFAYAHMRPALPPDEADADGATEVRFDLAAARPLAPLAAGSLVAWVGNLIHWGTCSLPGAASPPRASVGFNFLAQGERLQSSAPLISRDDARAVDLDGRLALIARSVLAYSPWYALADSTVPVEFYAQGEALAMGMKEQVAVRDESAVALQ